jgi:putative component of membrane protein insertase Oxa1/YidC/SpoIIIJ protein YidD
LGVLIRYIVLIFYANFFVHSAYCQSDKSLIDNILKASIEESGTSKKEPSVFKSIRLAKRPYLFLPAGLMWFYRNVVSEQITAECAYELSCSRFSASAIAKYGFIRGVWLTTDRLSRCNQMSPEESYLIWLDKQGGRIIDVPEMYH